MTANCEGNVERFEFVNRTRRARRMLGIAIGKPLVGPQVVSLETTHHCNLRCSFCESHGSLQGAPITARREYVGGRRSMSLEVIRRLAKEMAAAGVDLVELSGKGDPIAHPQLTEILRTLLEAGLQCSMVTNGTLAAPDLAPTIVQYGLSRLSVSLNAGSREVYLRSNHRDLWDAAVGFLGAVLDERRRAGTRRPWVRITHVVTLENFDDMDGMVDICVRLGVDEVTFYVLGELPETRSLQLAPDQVAWIYGMAPGWQARLEQAGIAHSLPAFTGDLAARTRGAEVQDNPLQKKLPCYEGWMFSVIGPDGAVVPCCYCEEEVMGNVVEQSFQDVWSGEAYRDFRERSLRMPETGRWICKECFTSCNRAMENQRIHNRIRPHRPVRLPDAAAAGPGPAGGVGASP